MYHEVFYFGFKINKNGIFLVKETIDAIKNAKEPRNGSESKSFEKKHLKKQKKS